MNRAILKAQLWELWRLSRLEIAYRSFGVLFIATLVQGVCVLMRDHPGIHEVHPVLMSMAFLALLADSSVPIIYNPSLVTTGEWRALLLAQYSRPVSTAQILGAPLLFEFVVRIVRTTLLAAAFPVISGLDFPIASIVVFALVAGFTLFCVLAAGSGFWRGNCAIAVLSGAVLVIHVPGATAETSLLDGPAQWHVMFQYSAGDYAIMTCLIIAFAVFAWRSLDSDRHGAPVKGAHRAFGAILPKTTSRSRRMPFPSPLRAQLWMEFRRISELWQVVAVGVPLAIGLSVISVWMNLPQFYLLTWTLVLITCPSVFILGAASQVSGLSRCAGAMKYSTFEATQTVSVAQSVTLKVALVFFTNLIASSVFLTAALLTWRYFPPSSTGRLDRLISGLNNLLYWGGAPGVAIATGVVLTTLSLTLALLSFAGLYALDRADGASPYRLRLSKVVEILILIYGLLAIVDLAANWDFTPFWSVSAWTIAIALVVATLASLWRVYKSRLVPLPAFATAALSWLAFLAALTWLCVVIERAGSGWAEYNNIHVMALCVGLSFIPLASFAWAPLSLAARRSQ